MVQTFGAGRLGVILLMASREGSDFGGEDTVSGTSGPESWTSAIVPAEIMGRVACHCASLRATPRHTGSVVRSAGLHTRPRMNL